MVPTAATVFVGYVRVSTEEQKVSGLSLEAQEKRVRAYAESHGSNLAHLFADPGVSCTQVPPHKRPGLCALLATLDRLPRGCATVVVYRLDRLGRNAREVLNLEHDLRSKGARLASVTESVDTSTPSGTAYLGLLSVFAQYEAELIAERTFVSMKVALSPNGARVGGVPPFGYATDALGLYVPAPQEAEVVRELFAGFLALRSFAAVATTLNTAGRRTRAGRTWSHATVGLVLRNTRTYAGARLWGRCSRRNGARDRADWVVLQGAHVPIVGEATANEVLAILGRRERRRAARRRRALGQQPAEGVAA